MQRDLKLVPFRNELLPKAHDPCVWLDYHKTSDGAFCASINPRINKGPREYILKDLRTDRPVTLATLASIEDCQSFLEKWYESWLEAEREGRELERTITYSTENRCIGHVQGTKHLYRVMQTWPISTGESLYVDCDDFLGKYLHRNGQFKNVAAGGGWFHTFEQAVAACGAHEVTL